MNLTIAQAEANVEAFIKKVDSAADVDIVLCPAYLSLFKVRALLRDTHIKVGGQDVFWKDQGAFTGQVSAPMLYDAGATFCIVGHSETRGRFGKLEIDAADTCFFAETDRTINQKLKALLYNSITPILCVGETQEERDAGKTEEVIENQLKGALEGIDAAELYFFVVAYEPVWAIGTGNTCEPDEAERVAKMIRTKLSGLLEEDVANEVRILYGGSVKSGNAKQLFAQPNIDGGLVGGASLDATEFSEIVHSA